MNISKSAFSLSKDEYEGTGKRLFIGLVIGTAVFSLFIGMSSRYSMVYGSLASIIILMLWFFLCGNILVLGNVVNFVLAKEKSDDDPTITFRLC